jgi:isopentenyldiphosphate isomerase
MTQYEYEMANCHFGQRLKERFGITFTEVTKNKLLRAIAQKDARFCGITENEMGKVLTFYTRILEKPMLFKVSDRGFFITCMNPSREVIR